MARIQILPLPTEKVGDLEQTPFVLILDQAEDSDTSGITLEMIEYLRLQMGARFAISYGSGTLDAVGAAVLSEEQREQLVTFLMTPRRWVTDDRYTDVEPTYLAGGIVTAETLYQ